MIIKYSLFSLIFFVLLNANIVQARDFRGFNKIPVAPKLADQSADLKVIQLNKNAIKTVDSRLIEKSIRKIVASWNTEELANYLDDAFQGKTLLLNIISREIPRDATLRLLAVQGMSTIEQKWSTNKKSHQRELRSVVIATVDLQLEFNDPFNGQVRLPHTSQFYLQVVETE